jgi:hypothetical protein
MKNEATKPGVFDSGKLKDGKNGFNIIPYRKEVNAMPRGDRTGPAGMGPTTGRGWGYCAGYDALGYASLAPGFGRGRSRGWRGAGPGWGGGGGRGWRHWYHATGLPGWARYGYPSAWPSMSEEQEVELLKNQAEALRREMEAVTKRLEDLEKEE